MGAPAGSSRAIGAMAAPPEYRRPSGVDEVPRREPFLLAEVGEQFRRRPRSGSAPPGAGLLDPTATAGRATSGRSRSPRRRARGVVPYRLQRTRSHAARGGRAGSPGTMPRMYLDVFDRNPYGTNCWLLGRRRQRGRGRRRPRVRARRRAGAARARREAPGRRAADPRARRPCRRRGRSSRATTSRLHPPGRRPRVRRPRRAGTRASTIRSTPVKDLRTIVGRRRRSRSRASRSRCCTRRDTRPGHCCFRDRRHSCSPGDLVFAGSIGRSDFPNSDPGGDAGEPAAVPHAARRRCGRAAGARAATRPSGASARRTRSWWSSR